MIKHKEIRWLLVLTKGYRLSIATPLVLSILAVALSILFVDQTRELIENIDSPSLDLWLFIFLLVITKLLQFVFEESETYMRSKVSACLENAYTLRAFSRLFQSMSKEVRSIHSGDEMSRLTIDVGVVTQCVSYTIPIIIYAIFQLLITSAYLLHVKPILTLVVLCIMPLMIAFGHWYARKLVPISREIRKQDSHINEYMQEHLQKHETIKSLGVSDYVIGIVRNLQQRLFKVIKKQIKYDVAAEAFIDLGFLLGYLIVLVYGVIGIRNGNFSYAMLIVFFELVGQLERPFILIKSQYPTLINSLASAERLIELEEIPRDSDSGGIKFNGAIGIDLNNITFAYENKCIYNNFSHDFKPGSVTAIVGETGVGKSTLFRLILAHLEPSDGKISIYTESGGCAVKASPDTRCNIIYVPQGNTLLSGTIRYNLQLGNLSATEHDMMNALQIAAADFVSDLPNGIDTVIGENGIGLSEGQAQRIAIARGLLHDGGVMLLDEPTSALDPETETTLLSRLSSNYTNKTILMITHKTSVRKYVDEILTIKQPHMQ